VDSFETGAYLVLEANGRSFPLSNGQSWAIGRGEGCAILLDARSVSRLHALVQLRDDGGFSLVDLGSRNGSFVNKRRVSLPVLLADDDRLVFGDQEMVFRNPARLPVSSASAALDARNQPTSALHAQKMTTIVVVDIRDFTPLARTVSESLLSQTVGTWFLRVGQIVQNLGSWGQRYIGDAVMAVWVHDHKETLLSDLRLALRSVAEINKATADISRTLPLPGPLRIGAGLNTGVAIVGGSDYTALGDTVNVAFRLETATKTLGMAIALGERTFGELQLTEPHPFARREVELKGYEGVSTAWAISFEDLEEFLRTWGK